MKLVEHNVGQDIKPASSTPSPEHANSQPKRKNSWRAAVQLQIGALILATSVVATNTTGQYVGGLVPILVFVTVNILLCARTIFAFYEARNSDTLSGNFRVLFAALAILSLIVMCGALYSVYGLIDFTQNGVVVHDGLSALYFSLMTITTVGYGDLAPTHGAARAVASLEVAAGWLLLGLYIAIIPEQLKRGRRGSA